MSSTHTPSLSVESTCTVLTCTSEEFQLTYNDGGFDTDALSDDLLINTIRNTVYAPNPSGKRYVAIALHIARHKGADAVVTLAEAWMQRIFLRMMTISRQASKIEPSGSQTPTLDETTQPMETASRSDQAVFRDELRIREDFRCAITHSYDRERAVELVRKGQHNRVPKLPMLSMAAAHIMPFLFNDFDTEATWTWDMFRCWTSINVEQLVGSKINTPENGIYMTTVEHLAFREFDLYLEAFPDVPNKYRVKMCDEVSSLSNGQNSADIEFRTTSSISPPDPEFLRVHAAFAKALYLSGARASMFMFKLWSDDEEGRVPLYMHPTNDFVTELSFRLAILAH